jgi:hypothetical protein
MDDRLKKLYDNLVKGGYEMPAYDQFTNDMRDPVNLRKLYDNVNKEYNLPDFATFASDMGIATNGAPAPTAIDKKKEVAAPLDGGPLDSAMQSTSKVFQDPLQLQSAVATTPTKVQAMVQDTGPDQDPVNKAINFVSQDYISNKDRVDKAVTQSADNPFGKQISLPSSEVLNDLSSPTGNKERFKAYLSQRLFDLDKQYRDGLNELEGKYPAKVDTQFMGPGMSSTTISHPEGYQAEADLLKKNYETTKEQLLSSAKILGDLKIANELKSSATPEQLSKGTWMDPKKAGRESRKLFGDPSVSKEEDYEMQGIPLKPSQKAYNDAEGLSVMQGAVMHQINEATKNGDPVPDWLHKEAQNVTQLQQNFLKDHDDFRRQQVIDALSNEIAKEKGGFKTTTGLYTISQEDIANAAEKLKLPKEIVSDIKSGDIKTENIFGALINGFNAIGSDIGAPIGRIFRKSILGQNPDAVDEYYNDLSDRYKSVFGRAPADQAIFNPQTKINTDASSTNFLFDEKNKDAGSISWNPAAILSGVTGAIGTLSKYVAGGEALGLAGLSSDAGMMATTFTTTYDDNYRQAKDMGLKSDAAANSFAFIRSLTNAFVFTKLMPTQKIASEILSPTSSGGKDLFNFIEQKGIDALTKEALHPILKKAIVEGLKDTGKMVGASEVDKAADFLTSATFDPHSLDNRDFLRESTSNAVQMALATIVPAIYGAGVRGRGESSMYKNMMYDMGNNPDPYINNIWNSYTSGNMTKEQAYSNIKIVGMMTKAVNATSEAEAAASIPRYKTVPVGATVNAQGQLSLPGVEQVQDKVSSDPYAQRTGTFNMERESNLSDQQKVDYAASLVRENVLTDKLEKLKGDEVQTKIIQSEIERLQKDRENILKNATGTKVPAQSSDATGVGDIPSMDVEQPVSEKPKNPSGQGGGTAQEETSKQEAAPVVSGEHQVMDQGAFSNLKPGDQVTHETPEGKIVNDSIDKVAGGEVKLKNEGTWRNDSVTDPKNKGYRFLVPQTSVNTNAAEAASAPKTLIPTAKVESKEGANIGFIPSRENAIFSFNKDGQVDIIAGKEKQALSVPGLLHTMYNLQDHPAFTDETPTILTKPIVDQKGNVIKKGEVTFQPTPLNQPLNTEKNAIHKQSSVESVLRPPEQGGQGKSQVELQEMGKGVSPIQETSSQGAVQTQAGQPPQKAVDLLKKAIDEGRVKGIYAQMVQSGQATVDQVIKDISDQAKGKAATGEDYSHAAANMLPNAPEVVSALTKEQQQQQPVSQTGDQLLGMLNQGRKGKDIYKISDKGPVADGDLIALTATNGKGETVANLLDPSGNVPEGMSANWRHQSIIVRDIAEYLHKKEQNDQTQGLSEQQLQKPQGQGSGSNAEGTRNPAAGNANGENIPNAGANQGESKTSTGAGSGANTKGAEDTGKQGAGQKSTGGKTKEEEIRDRIRAEKEAFRKAFAADRAKLGANPLPSAETITAALKLIKSYGELGLYKFSQIVRDLFSEDQLSPEEVQALQAAYGANRSLLPKAERSKLETDDQVDSFISSELPSLLKPAPEVRPEIIISGKSYNLIGKNSDGLPLYENSDGIRARAADIVGAIYKNEPVQIVPTRQGLIPRVLNRTEEFRTPEEIKNNTNGSNIEKRPTTHRARSRWASTGKFCASTSRISSRSCTSRCCRREHWNHSFNRGRRHSWRQCRSCARRGQRSRKQRSRLGRYLYRFRGNRSGPKEF